MDYIGSKEKLNSWMFSIISRRFPDPNGVKFFDACAGSGSTSRYAVNLGYDVTSCDLLSFSKFLIEGSIIHEDVLNRSEKHLEVMNNLCPNAKVFLVYPGMFERMYSPVGGRMYFTKENARRIDVCRRYLDTIKDKEVKNYLMYALLEAMSRVSNVAGTHGAFLKKFKKRALDFLTVRKEKVVFGTARAITGNLVDVLKNNSFDLIYIDPPYNERQYAPNYHLYESLVLYDDPEIHGKTGLRNDNHQKKSDFCSKNLFSDFLLNILSLANCPVYLSYSSDGLMSRDEIEELVFQCDVPSLSVHVLPQKRYKADNNRVYNDSFLKEFLIEISRT